MNSPVTHWINGAPHLSPSDRRRDVTDPASGEIIAEVPLAGPQVVHDAVSSASAAFEEWSRASLARRTQILFDFRHLLTQRRDELARVIVREHGKVLEDARAEVTRALDVVDFACGIPNLLKGEYSSNVSTDVDTYTVREPIGVAVGITPFNFPAMVPLWMAPIAIACGNTFVLKPSEQDPSASLALAETFADAGLPAGVFNVIQGDGQSVEPLLSHPDVKAVSFVGSTRTARHVYTTAASQGKRVQALGGAKNHAVVLPDANLDQAADALISAAYGSAGERCMAISAVVAVGAVGDELVGLLANRASTVVVGTGNDPAADMGPMISAEHRDRVASYVDAGVHEGASLILDGRDIKVKDHENGYYLGPCLFDHVSTDTTVYKDEIFGPVLVVLRSDTYDEAVDIVNANPYANGAAVFTRSGEVARDFERRIHAGMVGVNVPIPVPMAYHPFGGWKDSLFGDLHVYGPDGVRFYTRNKVMTTRWAVADHQPPTPDLHFPVSS